MKPQRSTYYLVSLVTAVILCTMLFSITLGRNMATRYAPLMDAVMETKLEIGIAHLWLEELIAGDSSVNIEKIQNHIGEAEWYINAMLEGGQNHKGTYVPLRDPELRKSIRKMLGKLADLEAQMEQRWLHPAESRIGSVADQRSDALFIELLTSGDEVEFALQRAMDRELDSFLRTQLLLILGVGVLGVLVGWLLYCNERKRIRSYQALKMSEERLSHSQRIAQIGSWELDLESNRLWWSEETYRIFEMDPAVTTPSFEGFVAMIHPDDRQLVQETFRQAVANRTTYNIIHRLLLPDQRIKYVNERGQTYYDKAGNPLRSVGSVHDITERKQTEDALRHSQKMEAVGQLTGGIAHDFNNILGIIIGNIELLNRQTQADEKVHNRLQVIKRSATRAATLVRQLLGFSRKEERSIEEVDLCSVIKEMEDLIRRSVTPQVEVESHLAKGLWHTCIDVDDFRDALLNLVINARDAMDGQGQLTLETANRTLDAAYCVLNPDAHAGDFVVISVSDNGSGISPTEKAHLFEPFYTTKEPGKGTGLGLSMVYGFVIRSRGHIKVYSEPEVGTTFRIYLPRSCDAGQETDPNTPATTLQCGDETILAVDDEGALLEVARELLEALGYRVVTASSGAEALEVLERTPEIAMLFSDVVMPGGMNGFELAEEATRRRPGLKVLLTSGYSERAIARSGQAIFRANQLDKPYSQTELARRVREILDGSPPDGSSAG